MYKFYTYSGLFIKNSSYFMQYIIEPTKTLHIILMLCKVLSKFNRHVFGWCSCCEFACMYVAIELYMTIYMNAEGKMKTIRLRNDFLQWAFLREMVWLTRHWCVEKTIFVIRICLYCYIRYYFWIRYCYIFI